jgi:hypothetical protein
MLRPADRASRKAGLIRAGKFVATNAEGTLSVVSRRRADFAGHDLGQDRRGLVERAGRETQASAFYNLWLGLPYEMRGDAPDHVRLLERRGGYPRGRSRRAR